MSARQRTLAACGFVLALCAAPGVGAGAETASDGSYLGVHAQSNSNVLDDENVYQGITVTSVVENSPAAGAGLLPGDVLLEANGVALAHPDTLDDLVEKLAPGAPVKLRLERARRPVEVEVRTVARIPALPPPVESAAPTAVDDSGTLVERRRLGFEFRAADPARLAALGLSQRFGVVVERVAARSPLREVGVDAGDLVLEADGQPIPSAGDLLRFLDGLRTERTLDLVVWDAEQGRREVDVALHKPERRLTKLGIPLLFSFERKAQLSDYSALLGLIRVTRLENGSRIRLLYFFDFETGSTDELIDVGGKTS
jgi:S1-C subfamily serine protease